jgi:hypothetical protein
MAIAAKKVRAIAGCILSALRRRRPDGRFAADHARPADSFGRLR